MQRRKLKIKAKGLQIGAAFGITNWTKVGLQIGAASEITNWGKKITNWCRTTLKPQFWSFQTDLANFNLHKILKELQNYNRKLFLCPHKNRWKHNHNSKLLFFKINLLFGILD